MDDNLSGIYDDLENTDLGTQILNLQERNNTLQKHIEILANHVHALNKEVNELKTTQENLKKNISELFNTAKAEIGRKDRMIAELRQQLDDVILRRNNRVDSKKRPIEEDGASISRASYSAAKRTKHVSEDRHVMDVRRGSSSDDARYKTDRRRDDRSWDYRSRDRPSYHDSRDYRDNSRHRDSSKNRRHHRTSHYRDDHKSSEDPRRNSSNHEKRVDNKNHKEIKASTSPNNEITDLKSQALEDKFKKDINVLEAEDQGSVCNITDTVSLKEDSSSKDSRVSKVDLEAYVKLERTLEIDFKDDSPKTTELVDEVKEASESWEKDKLLITEKTDLVPVLSTSSQELQNAIDSIKNEPFNTKVTETVSIEVNVVPTSTDNADSSNNIISINNVKSNDKATSNCNKSFRSRRRRCVITVNE